MPFPRSHFFLPLFEVLPSIPIPLLSSFWVSGIDLDLEPFRDDFLIIITKYISISFCLGCSQLMNDSTIDKPAEKQIKSDFCTLLRRLPLIRERMTLGRRNPLLLLFYIWERKEKKELMHCCSTHNRIKVLFESARPLLIQFQDSPCAFFPPHDVTFSEWKIKMLRMKSFAFFLVYSFVHFACRRNELLKIERAIPGFGPTINSIVWW